MAALCADALYDLRLWVGAAHHTLRRHYWASDGMITEVADLSRLWCRLASGGSSRARTCSFLRSAGPTRTLSYTCVAIRYRLVGKFVFRAVCESNRPTSLMSQTKADLLALIEYQCYVMLDSVDEQPDAVEGSSLRKAQAVPLYFAQPIRCQTSDAQLAIDLRLSLVCCSCNLRI